MEFYNVQKLWPTWVYARISSRSRNSLNIILLSCVRPTLFDSVDCTLPGSSVHGILQARILKWVAIPFSRRSSWSKDWTQVSWIAVWFFIVWTTREIPYVCSCSPFTICLVMHWNYKRGQKKHVLSRFSCVWVFIRVWTVVCQAPLSMGFSR